MSESYELVHNGHALDAGIESLAQLAARLELLRAELHRLRSLAARGSHAEENRLRSVENRLWRAICEVRV